MSGDGSEPRSDRITRHDIETRLRALGGGVESKGQSIKETGVAVAGAAGAGLLGLVFWLGRRRGRRKSTVVEITRR